MKIGENSSNVSPFVLLPYLFVTSSCNSLVPNKQDYKFTQLRSKGDKQNPRQNPTATN